MSGVQRDRRQSASGQARNPGFPGRRRPDDVSDNYVSKTPFAVSEFSNVVRHGASVLSGEALLCANLAFGLRLVSNVGDQRHTLLFDTGPEGSVFIRNCRVLGIAMGEVEAIAVVMERNIAETVDGLRPFGIQHIITGHCTGWRALHALANVFGEAVSQSAVGTTYRFSAS